MNLLPRSLPAASRFRLWIVALFFAVGLVVSAADVSPLVTRIEPPKKILFVGNSYTYFNNSLHSHLEKFVREADAKAAASYQLRALTLSGAELTEQVALLPGMLKTTQWDVVILQGRSDEAMKSNAPQFERFVTAARQCDTLIRNSGAVTVFFMTPAYQDKPEMTAAVREGYVAIGNELHALVVPVGLAFQHALAEVPGVVLHQSDKSHPSLAGTYLAACVFYGALYQKSPVGLSYTAHLEPKLATTLQAIAWKTVVDFSHLPEAVPGTTQ